MWNRLGPRHFGRRAGTLSYAPRAEDIHWQHVIFMWPEGGNEYQASLHAWDDRDASIDLLRALVISLVPPEVLPQGG